MAEAGLVILTPVFNDWEAYTRLLSTLDDVLSQHGLSATVVAIDDGSTRAPASTPREQPLRAIARVDVLKLKRNLGHQRAICVGLAYLEAHFPCHTVIVMDSDGEDDPRYIPDLLRQCREKDDTHIVFAERTRRSESPLFRVCYAVFQVLHHLLTGHHVRFGNYSAIPWMRLQSLVSVSELWSHYAAAVICSRQPYCGIPTNRGKRTVGNSKMNFIGLVIHGLSAISVFSAVVGVRLVLATTVLAGLSLVGMGSVVMVRLFSSIATPGWATFTSAILFVVFLQAIMFAVVFSFIVLNGRQEMTFIPSRDYTCFVASLTTQNLC